MTTEGRIRRWFSETTDSQQLSPDFTERIMREVSTPRQPLRSGWRSLAPIGLVSGFVLVLGVGGILLIGRMAATQVPSSATTASLGSGAGPVATLTHFEAPGLAFDFPASWSVTRTDVHMHYETVLGFVGNGTGAEICPSDALPGEFNNCTTQIDLQPSSVVVKMSLSQMPIPPSLTALDFVASSDPNAARLTVGGLPAVLETLPGSTPGVDTHLRWTLTTPGMSWGRFTLDAFIRGPDTDAIRGQLDELISTVRLSSQSQ